MGIVLRHLRPSRQIIKLVYLILKPSGLGLLEIMVALGVFGLVVVASGGTFVAVQRAWDKQKLSIELVQSSRWAMEFMVNELRQGGNITIISGGQRLRFRPYPGPPTAYIWYWRGNTSSDTTGLGNRAYLYRGVGMTIAAAYSVRQPLTTFMADNPSLNDIFTSAGISLFITIELTLSPDPTLPPGPNNREYTLRTRVRPRN